jgi:hypothetical protein
MGWECGTHKGEGMYIYEGLSVRKSEGMKQLERSALRWKIMLKYILKIKMRRAHRIHVAQDRSRAWLLLF